MIVYELLNIFEKKSYVGYTATPFANIFVNEKPIQNNAEKTYFQRILS